MVVLLVSVSVGQTYVLQQNFESIAASGEAVPGWVFQNAQTWNLAGYGHNSDKYAGWGEVTADSHAVRSPLVTNPGTLTFWLAAFNDASNLSVRVQVSTDGTTWTDKGTYPSKGAGGDFGLTFFQKSITLNLLGSYYIKFATVNYVSGGFYVDDVLVTEYFPPQLTVSKTSIAFGSVLGNVAKVDSFFVKDTSATSATITAVTNAKTQYVVTAKNGNLTPTLASKDSAWYYVTFTPDAVGAVADTVKLTYAAGTIAIPLSGTGTNPILTRNSAGAAITGLSWVSDTLRPGVAKLDSFQIRNNGLASINVTGFANVNDEFTFTPAPPFAVPETSTVWVYTSYVGTAPGRDLDTLVITHNSAVLNSSPLKLALSARTSASLRFGAHSGNTNRTTTIDETSYYTINAGLDFTRSYTTLTSPTLAVWQTQVTNGSTVPGVGIDSLKLARVQVFNDLKDSVLVDSITITGTAWKSLVPTPYLHRVGAAYDRVLSFTFRPKEAKVYTDTIFVWSNDPNGSPIKLVIKGQGTRRAHVVNTANASTLAFGNVSFGLTSTLPLRILNLQDITLTVDSVAFDEKSPNYSFIAKPTAEIVGAGLTREFSVQFTTQPTDSNGQVIRDTVLVYAAGYQAAPFRVPVSATVLTNIIFVPSASPIAVGGVPVASSKDTTIKVFNRTKTNYTLTGLTLTRGQQFVILTNTASQALNAGDSVSIVIRFTPTADGLFRDTLVISNNIPTTILATNPYRIALNGRGDINYQPDPLDYWTVDNASGIEGYSIQSPDSSYQESGPFWQNAAGYGGTHRRSPNLSGSANGSSARWTFNLDSTGTYLAYHFMLNSPNAGANYYVHFRKFGFGGIIDSFRLNLLDHNSALYATGTWLPMAVHYYAGVGPQAMSVTIGADERSSTFMRLDAIRLLRSRLPADLEFGRRDINFTAVRVQEDAPQVTVGDENVRNYRLYNLGTDTLKVTDMTFFPTLTPVPWFYFKNYTAGTTLAIPPMTVSGGIESGGYFDVQIAFNPFQEGFARDSLVITSNDPKEPKAYIIWSGEGLNYNFILNASVGGTEPHFRAPAPPSVTTLPRYTELATGTWANSTASPMFPITGANLSSRVNTAGAATTPHEAYFDFELPDLVYNTISTFGDYILEHSGPAGSSNGHTQGIMRVNHTFGIPQDTALFSTFNQAAGFIQVGNSLKTFKLSPGGPIRVTVARKSELDIGTTSVLLRVDLLRVRKVPTGALIGVNVAPTTSIDFGDVNFRNPAGPTGTLNKREFTIGSRGESQLVISNMRFRNGSSFSVVSAPAYPTFLRAISGELKVTVAFAPNRITPGYVDTLEIVSNSTRDSLLLVRVVGNGIGGIFTVDDGGLVTDRGSYPALDGLYLNGWDKTKMTRWQIQTVGVADSIGIGNSRRMLPMKLNTKGYFEWYPLLPAELGQSDSMWVGVYAAIPAGLSGAAPAAKYSVFPGGGAPRRDTVVSQNGRTAIARGVAEVFLGNYWFIRGGQDAFRAADTLSGGGSGIFGHVRVSADTAAANFAGTDTLALVADAVIIRELEPPASGTTGVEESEIPTEFALDQNYPNPFNPSTTIRFALPIRANVDLKVFDLLGREVRTLVRGDQFAPGVHSVTWDGRNAAGNAVATGVYFYRINASGFTESRKMLLLK
jgi:hypothetical protein